MNLETFDAVHLLDEVERLGGHKGLAAANTSYFRSAAGYTVVLDVTKGLVTIRHKNGGAIVVPRERVRRFEPSQIGVHTAMTGASTGGPSTGPDSSGESSSTGGAED